LSLRSAIIAGGIFTIVMMLVLAAFGSVLGSWGVLIWAVLVIAGWLWLFGRARPKGTR